MDELTEKEKIYGLMAQAEELQRAVLAMVDAGSQLRDDELNRLRESYRLLRDAAEHHQAALTNDSRIDEMLVDSTAIVERLSTLKDDLNTRHEARVDKLGEEVIDSMQRLTKSVENAVARLESTTRKQVEQGLNASLLEVRNLFDQKLHERMQKTYDEFKELDATVKQRLSVLDEANRTYRLNYLVYFFLGIGGVLAIMGAIKWLITG